MLQAAEELRRSPHILSLRSPLSHARLPSKRFSSSNMNRTHLGVAGVLLAIVLTLAALVGLGVIEVGLRKYEK